MISDSPYNVGTRVLSPVAGLITGFIAAMVMLGLLAALQSVSGLSLATVLNDLGRIVSPGLNSPTTNFSLILVGWGPLALLGALLGLLYAMCQQRVPISGLIGVGLFYGFILWVLSKVTIGLFLHQIAQSRVSGWLWLLAWLLYGLCLAAASVLFQLRPSARTAQLVLKD